jgi:hypothetical protein
VPPLCWTVLDEQHLLFPRLREVSELRELPWPVVGRVDLGENGFEAAPCVLHCLRFGHWSEYDRTLHALNCSIRLNHIHSPTPYEYRLLLAKNEYPPCLSSAPRHRVSTPCSLVRLALATHYTYSAGEATLSPKRPKRLLHCSQDRSETRWPLTLVLASDCIAVRDKVVLWAPAMEIATWIRNCAKTLMIRRFCDNSIKLSDRNGSLRRRHNRRQAHAAWETPSRFKSKRSNQQLLAPRLLGVDDALIFAELRVVARMGTGRRGDSP